MTADSTNQPADDSDNSRWRYGLVAVALGVGALSIVAPIIVWLNPTGAASVVGVVASPIAAIIGAYFGVQVSGSAAKDAQDRAATAERDRANALADRATVLGALDPQTARELMPRLHFKP
jgi:hypothetical protein